MSDHLKWLEAHLGDVDPNSLRLTPAMKAEFDALERQLDDIPSPPSKPADKPQGDPFDDWAQELIAEGRLTEDEARDPTLVEAAYLKRADEQAIALLKDTLPKLEARLERARHPRWARRQIATVKRVLARYGR